MAVPGAGRRVPADRYGTSVDPRRRRWRLLAWAVVLGTVVAVGVGLAYWLAHPGVQFGLTSFQVTGPDAVTITFQVTKAPAEVAECVVRSRDLSGAEVGRQTVRVPARTDGVRDVTMTVHLTTTGTPNSGEVYACRAVGT